MMTQEAKKIRKIAKNCEKWSQKGAYPKMQRSPRKRERTPLKKGRSPSTGGLCVVTAVIVCGSSSNRQGGRTPAHCDASRISAGVQFISSAAARPNHAKHIQNLPIPCSKGSKSFQIPPQTLPKPSPNPPKATQNPSKRPLGAHLGPML